MLKNIIFIHFYLQHVLGGRVILKKKKFPPFYTRLPSWIICMKKMENIRNQDKVLITLSFVQSYKKKFLQSIIELENGIFSVC